MIYTVRTLELNWVETLIELEGDDDTPDNAMRLVLKGEGSVVDETPEGTYLTMKGKVNDGDSTYDLEYESVVLDDDGKILYSPWGWDLQ